MAIFHQIVKLKQPDPPSPKAPVQTRTKPTKRSKTPVSIRLDEDLIAAMKAGGRGWQSKANAVLRAHFNLPV